MGSKGIAENVTEDLLRLYELALSIGQKLDPVDTCRDFLKILVPRHNLTGAVIWWRYGRTTMLQPLAALPDLGASDCAVPIASRLLQLSQGGTPCVIPPGAPFHLELSNSFGGVNHAFALYPFAQEGVLLMQTAQLEIFSSRMLNGLRPVLNALGTAIQGGIAHERLALSEKQLIEQRSFLKTLIQTLPDLVWLKDPNGTYLACNPRFELFFGASEAEILGKTDHDFVDREMADSFRIHDQRAIETGGPSVNEEWITFADDRHRELVETTKTPMFDEQGGLIGVLGIAHDVTEDQALRQQLIAERDRSQSYLDTVDTVIVSLDTEGHITMINRKGCEILGYAQEDELIGKFWFQFCLIQPEGMQQVYPAFQKIFSGDHAGMKYFENSIQTRTGGTRLIAWHNTYYRDVEGNIVGTLSAGTDITERKQAEESLRQAASVFEHANEGITITDSDGDILDVNRAFTQITGYRRDEVLGKNQSVLKSDRHNDAFYSDMWRVLKRQGHWTGEIWNRRKNGDVYAVMLTISSIQDQQGKAQRYVSLFSDITALKEHQKQLEHIAHYDVLTGLPNRVLLADRLHQAMVQTQRHSDLLAVVYLDLDGFKAINDNHGHDVGDRLLVQLAGRLQNTLREGDSVARLGGDEFVVVLLDLSDHEDCTDALGRLLDAAAESARIADIELRVSASLGVTFFPQADEVDADQLLRQADQAMYQAKQAGKNRYHLFDMEHDRSVRGHHESLKRIREALHKQEFVLYYQPKVNMRTGEVKGVEALIRWQHPDLGLLLPGKFLPMIEDHQLAIEIGDWVLETALTQIDTWQQGGLTLPVSVNINAQHLQQHDFVERLREKLSRHPDALPDHLELEMLETSVLRSIAQVSDVIRACQKIDVDFALDDFGTGYSSLTYLKRLPAKLLKIDQSFVSDMLDDPDDLAILEGVLGLANAFGRQAIAEGVETLAHGKMLLQIGCELGQGYAIARPMPPEDINDWLSSWRPDESWLNCLPLSPNDQAVLFAAVEHRAWLADLGRYLRDEQAGRPVMDSLQCRLGEWLEQSGKVLHKNHPATPQIVALHESMHRRAETLIAYKQQGNTQRALSQFDDIKALLDELLELVFKLVA